jgi:DNA replication protein DnaC
MKTITGLVTGATKSFGKIKPLSPEEAAKRYENLRKEGRAIADKMIDDNRKAYEARRRELAESNAKIPVEFKDAMVRDFEALNDNAKKHKECAVDYVLNFERHAKNGTCMLFLGGNGTGKTMLACAILNAVKKKYNAVVMYINAYVGACEFKDASNYSNYANQSGVMRKFVSSDLLVIDELDKMEDSDVSKKWFFNVLNERQCKGLSTIVVSNYAFDRLCSAVGASSLERFRQGEGKVLQFDWESQRGVKDE